MVVRRWAKRPDRDRGRRFQ